MHAMMEEHPEPAPADHDRPLIYELRSTQTDHELRAIEWIMTILAPLPHATQVRALTYIRERIESDGTVSTTDPVSGTEVAVALAEADGRDWAVMSAVEKSPYYRRAQWLTTNGLTVIRTGR